MGAYNKEIFSLGSEAVNGGIGPDLPPGVRPVNLHDDVRGELDGMAAYVDGHKRRRGNRIDADASPLSVEVPIDSPLSDLKPHDLTPDELLLELSRMAVHAKSETNRVKCLDILCKCKNMYRETRELIQYEPIMVVDEDGKKLLTLHGHEKKVA
jgi:hypothetical protein